MYRVLIVEDETPVRKKMVENVDWASLGFQVVYDAADGQEALTYLEEHQVDLILTDIYMPFIDGLELIRQVRKTNKYCKVIFLTGYNEFDYAKEAIELEASQYLLKPITKKELTEVLSKTKERIDEAIAIKRNLTLLEGEYERNLSFLREKLLYDIIAGFLPENRIKQAYENLKCAFEANFYRLGIIEVVNKDVVAKKIWSDDYSLLHFAMFNISKEILEEEGESRILLGEQGKIIVIFTENQENGFVRHTYELLNEVLHTIGHIYDLPLTAGISQVYTSMSDLKYAYKEAITAIEYNVLEGYNRVIVKSDIEPNSLMNKEKLEDYIEAILSGLKLSQEEVMADYLKLYFEQLKFDKYGLNDIKTLILSLITKVFDTYNQMCLKEEMKEILDFKVVEKIYGLEDFSILEQKILEIFSQLCEKLRYSREDDKHHMVVKALQFIEENYGDSGLDLNQISEGLNMSTSYFSRIFKKEKAQTFLEYLTQYRMEKAKELLKASDMKVYEISERVGYEDAHYFSYNFRKNVGMTPSQFRKA